MTDRERFLRIMAFQPVDRLPVLAFEPFEKRAVDRWRNEGLPADADPMEFLGMSRLVHVPVNLGPVPAYEPTIVAEREDSYDQVTSMGATVRRNRDNPLEFYGHIDHPLKTRRDWDEYRRRFDPATAAVRIPADWPAVAARLNAAKNPVALCLFPFFFRFGFYAMGMQRFLTAFHDEPDLMHEIFAQVSELAIATVRPLLATVKIDVVLFTEDLAGKNGPLVSPAIYEEFWRPHQEPVIRLFREHGVPLICQWTAGRFHELLPSMIAQGFNCTWPLEVMAGMDAAALRREFGSRLCLAGNIPKEAVMAGPEAIDREIERLLPVMRTGGFIPALDDVASQDMPFAHYRHLIERLQAIQLDS